MAQANLIPVPDVAQWVQHRLSNVVNTYPGIHFENSMYGPLTSYLNTLFPTERCFMVKPQGILRNEHTGDFLSDISEQGSVDYSHADDADMLQDGDDDVPVEPDDEEAIEESVEDIKDEGEEDDGGDEGSEEDMEAANTSFDSYGNQTTSSDFRFPDFLIVKATETLKDDTLLLIVEVKKKIKNPKTARFQMETYLQMAATKHRDPLLKGLLIMGPRAEVFSLDSSAHDAKPKKSHGRPFNTTGKNLKTLIHSIAERYW